MNCWFWHRWPMWSERLERVRRGKNKAHYFVQFRRCSRCGVWQERVV